MSANLTPEEMQRRAEQAATRDLNDLARRLGMMGSSVNWKYYPSQDKKNRSRAKDRYFYTSEKVNHKGKPRYLSGVYRYNATKKIFVAQLVAGHAKKQDAIARARKMSGWDY